MTFLFTDVEGSTASWERSPEAMDKALLLHDVVVREAVDEFGGVVFATGGDGFATAFATAGEAVLAAVGAQRRLHATSWPAGASMVVRMGLHTGRATERDGDFFGPAVNRAARLMSVASGAQVLCSSVTAQLAQADLGDDVTFELIGPVRLSGVPEPVEAYCVLISDVALGRSRPVTADGAAGVVPNSPTRLIGRDREVDDLLALVRRERLVTLTGIGGVAKTRLAMEVAAA